MDENECTNEWKWFWFSMRFDVEWNGLEWNDMIQTSRNKKENSKTEERLGFSNNEHNMNILNE